MACMLTRNLFYVRMRTMSNMDANIIYEERKCYVLNATDSSLVVVAMMLYQRIYLTDTVFKQWLACIAYEFKY